MNLENINVVDFLLSLGIRNVKENGEEIQFSCPFPGHKNGDANPSASMQLETTITHCFGCGWSGNAISFLADLEGVSSAKAIQWIREEYGGGFKDPDISLSHEINEILEKKEIIITEPEIKILPETELEKRYVDWQLIADTRETYKQKGWLYLLDRGFSPQTLLHFDIGYDPISGRFSIPYKDEYGNLIGFKGRLGYESDTEPRYQVLGGPEYGFDTFPVNNYIFGIHLLDEYIQDMNDGLDSDWILCEGELNAISCYEKGYFALGISGRYLSNKQAIILAKYPGPITLIFDEQEDAIAAARKIEPYFPVLIAPEHERDPAEMTQEEISYLLGNSISSILL